MSEVLASTPLAEEKRRSLAFVSIPGEGNIIINKRNIDDYFGYETLKTQSFVSRWF